MTLPENSTIVVLVPETDSVLFISLKKRNGRKGLTIMEGAPEGCKLKSLLHECKKRFTCNGCIITEPLSKNNVEIIQLQGDHRIQLAEFLKSPTGQKLILCTI